MLKLKNLCKLFILMLFSIFCALSFCEVFLRIKHNYITHYDIEMWKYAKTLKIQNKNKDIGHTHKKNASAILQKVNISINNYGQRDGFINNKILQKYERKFLILGSSIALGWGVEQNQTFSAILNDLANKNNKNWIFINGGIGNHNTKRYVNNYLTNWSELEFTDIIINFFVNDTEILLDKKTNFLIKHSHLAVVIWKFIKSYKSNLSEKNLENYYKRLYENNFVGFIQAKSYLSKLNNHCKINNINCSLYNMPDIHQLNPYKLNFINKKMSVFSKSIDLEYYDLLNLFEGLSEKKFSNDYNDNHPNFHAHNLIGMSIFENLIK